MLSKIFQKKNRIWGLEYEIIGADYPIWKIYIRNPFFNEGKYRVGINRKLILEAVKSGVQRFILQVGQKEIPMNVPSEKGLKEKENNNEFEDRPSMFEGSQPMRIYFFNLPPITGKEKPNCLLKLNN